jgi:hypothetical protein
MFKQTVHEIDFILKFKRLVSTYASVCETHTESVEAHEKVDKYNLCIFLCTWKNDTGLERARVLFVVPQLILFHLIKSARLLPMRTHSTDNRFHEIIYGDRVLCFAPCC